MPDSNVRAIRPGLKIAKKPTDEDELTAYHARVAKAFIADLGKDGGLTDAQRIATADHIAAQLPRANLRCIVSTLDERRDFDLRCVEVEIAHTEHLLEARRIDRLGILEGDPYWWERARALDSDTLRTQISLRT
jgi:hypothetical protein